MMCITFGAPSLPVIPYPPAVAFAPLRLRPGDWQLVALVLAVLVLALLIGMVIWHVWRNRYARTRAGSRWSWDRDEHLKLALWASGEQFWDYDLANRTVYRLRAHEGTEEPNQITVVSRHGMLPRIHEQDLPMVMERLRQHLQGDTPLFMSEHRMDLHERGQWVWVRTRGRVVERDAEGHPTRLAGTARDITRSRNAEFERRIASEVLHSMNEAVAVLDPDFRFVGFNPAFSSLVGYGEEAMDQPLSLLDSVREQLLQPGQLQNDLSGDGRWGGEMWMRRKDGEEILFRVTTTPVHDETGRYRLYVLVLNDITEQKHAEAELRRLAHYDSLTGLPNRRLLFERLDAAIHRAHLTDQPLAVLFIDLDRFKDVNDSLGHDIGDRILRESAQRVQDAAGLRHTVARLSGDEFTVILENSDVGQAEAMAERIIAAFAPPLHYGERQEVLLTPSVGISLYPQHARIAADLIKHADTAMYQAKAAGRRTFEVYSRSMNEKTRQRVALANSLRRVLENNELSMAYQPRLSLNRQRITGVEALLRWDSPQFGSIPPAEFIPLAEETGLILEIGAWALREACLALQHWRHLGRQDLSMAVNVSALQLMRGNLPQMVAHCLRDTFLPAELLELELTESVVMANPAKNADTLRACRNLGVGLAIDDFGTGYSSLAYLKRLPITTLKIDREFIGDLGHDPDDEAITGTIIAMGHSLGLKVVAEGVETPGQLQFLREHGCDEVQGFWVAPALPRDACFDFIEGYRYGPQMKIVS